MLDGTTYIQKSLRYWESRAERFENLYRLRIQGIKKILRESYKFLENIEDIVDVGCGTGIPDHILTRELGKNLIATDFSRCMLRKALSKQRIQYLVRADALHLTFPRHSLGAILCITVLTDYENKRPFYREFYSCLKKDGIYVHGDYSPDDEYWNLNEHIYPLAFSSRFKLHRQSIKETEENLVQEGFSMLKSKSVNFKVPITVDNYLRIIKSRPGFEFNLQREEEVRQIAENYLIDNELNRELILIISKRN